MANKPKRASGPCRSVTSSNAASAASINAFISRTAASRRARRTIPTAAAAACVSFRNAPTSMR